MQIIARHTLIEYGTKHPLASPSLEHWFAVARRSSWGTTAEVQAAFRGAKVLNGERVRFEVAGGQHRMIVAFRFGSRLAFIKFIGTHAEYDRVDAFTVSLF